MQQKEEADKSVKLTVNKEKGTASASHKEDIKEGEPEYGPRNPYLTFLNAIEDEDFEAENEYDDTIVTKDVTDDITLW